MCEKNAISNETKSDSVLEEMESAPFEEALNYMEEDNYSKEQKETTSNGYEVTVLPDPLPRIVKTDDGSKLNYRSEPVDGDKLGQFPDGTNVLITKLTDETFTVDGITDAWYFAFDSEIPSHGGWVFGGYLSVIDSVSNSSSNSRCNLKFLTGFWENEYIVLEILDSNNSFNLGRKESEGFGGTWKLLDDDTLHVYDCSTYDEDPWTVEYKIAVCTEDELVLVRKEDNYSLELQRADHPFFNLDE